MNSIKHFINIITQNPFDEIYLGNPTVSTYKQALEQFTLLSQKKQRKLVNSIMQRIYNRSNFIEVISCMLLMDYLSIIHKIQFNNYTDKVQKSQKFQKITPKCSKNQTVQNIFIQLYWQYIIKNRTLLRVQLIKDQSSCLVESLINCEIIYNLVLQLIRTDFVIEYLLKFKKQIKIINLICDRILSKTSESILFLYNFVDQWGYLIINKSQYNFLMNEIYQKTIFISKKVNKFKYLNRIVNCSYPFPSYNINKNLNHTIQDQMNGSQCQKLQHDNYKYLKNNNQNINIKQLAENQDTMMRLNDDI